MNEFEKYFESLLQDEFFQLLWNSLTDGINILDREGNVILANDSFCKLMYREREEIIGHPFTEHYAENLRNQILHMYQRNFRLKQLTPHFTRELILWNDKKVWLEFFNHLFVFPDGESVVLRVVRNLSELKKMEREYEESSDMLRNLATRQQTIREDERTTIAREIHDELGQVLTVLKIQNSLVAKKLNPDQKELISKMKSADNMINQAVDSVQKICSKLRPGILDNLGLVPAIEWQCKEFEKSTGIKCNYELFKGELMLRPQKATAVYRIFQETLTNVARHSEADKINVEFSVSGNNITLKVSDNGKGISDDKIQLNSSLGLIGMKERALMFNGEVEVIGKSGIGTTVSVRFPKKDNRELL